MCIICIEFNKGGMRKYDAMMAYVELKGTLDEPHREFLEELLKSLDDEENEVNG